jgi:hypothetical protein
MNMQWWSSCLKEGHVSGPEGVNILDFNKNLSTLSSGISHHIQERKLISGDNWRNDRHFAMVEQLERHSG